MPFEVGASRLQSLKGPEKSFTATSGDAPTHMGFVSLGFAVSEKAFRALSDELWASCYMSGIEMCFFSFANN